MAAPQSFEKQDSTVRGQDNTMDTNKRDEKDIGLSHKESFEHVELAKPEILIESMDEFGAHAKTDPREIALVKKLDRYIMPMLWVMYFMNFLDRNAIVNGKLNDLDKDLGMKGTQYNTCVSILFVGYLLGQIPSNMMLNRVRPSLFMAGFSLAWSIVSLLTMFTQSYVGMIMARFFLGVTEAPFYPGALFLVSIFYTRKEVATRMSIFYSGNTLASAFSGLIAAPIFEYLDGRNGLEGWRWLFLIQGLFSVAVSIVAFFILPDSPLKTRWLTPEERLLAHARIEMDTTQRKDGTNVWKGLYEAVTDYKTWILTLTYNLHLSANGFKNFLPTVVKTLGFNTTVTLALTCPPYLLSAIVTILVAYSSGRMNERTWHITISKLLAIAGFIIGFTTLNIGARYFAMVLFVGATYGVNNITLGWVAATLGQTNEKKAAAIAIANTLGNLSFVYTPYLWPDADGPRFQMAMCASVGFSAGVIICAWTLKLILKRLNRKLRESDDEVTNFYVY